MAVTPAAAARDDRDRELWRLLVDEPETGVILREQAVPGRADRDELVEDDQRSVTGAAGGAGTRGRAAR